MENQPIKRFNNLTKPQKITLAVAFLLALTAITAALIRSGQRIIPVNYSKAENWAYFAQGEGKEADLFLIAPTADMGGEGRYNMSIADQNAKKKFVGALNMERGIYDEVCRLYAPYYRQATQSAYELGEWEADPYLDVAYADVRAAFLRYMRYENKSRAFVLAGSSQGAELALRLMKEFMKESQYRDQMAAAYLIGCRVTQADADQFPYLQMAQGEKDIGVIVCFSCEAERVTDTVTVPAGTRTLGINPLNWKTDATPADAGENLGACFTDDSGKIEKEIPQLCGAYLDLERGTLKVTGADPADYTETANTFSDGVNRLYDCQLFYRNLQKNVGERVAAFLVQE